MAALELGEIGAAGVITGLMAAVRETVTTRPRRHASRLDAGSMTPRPPTTPQTEAGLALLEVLRIQDRTFFNDTVDWNHGVLAIEHEAAAGALPSVERLIAEADQLNRYVSDLRLEEHTMLAPSIREQQSRYVEAKRAYRAAPPEASER